MLSALALPGAKVCGEGGFGVMSEPRLQLEVR